MQMPIHLADHYYDPNKKYCGLYIVAKMELPAFGPTTELIRIFDKRAIPLLTINSHTKDGNVYNFLMVDLTDKEGAKEEIVEEIKTVFANRLVYFRCIDTGIKGFIYNINGFPLIFNFSNNHSQAAALTASTWKTLIMGIVKRYGVGASVILWYMGNDAGEGKARIMMGLQGLSNVEMVKIGLARLQSLGWGRFDLIECDELGKRVVIRVFDNFEEMITKELLDYQNSFLKGFLVGLISTIFGKACRGIEVKCVNKGDPYCEFLLR